MNKALLVNRVARDRRLPRARVAPIIDSFLDQIVLSLKRGDRASLVGFGTFTVVRRRARAGRNPQTGETIAIPARRGVRFTPGRTLKLELR
jgi:DNA-binding protein HU-beta